ncbi:MAG: Smr/MutS family protein [Pseudomonadota bacterium]
MKDRRLNEDEAKLWRRATKDVAPITKPQKNPTIVRDPRDGETKPASARQIADKKHIYVSEPNDKTKLRPVKSKPGSQGANLQKRKAKGGSSTKGVLGAGDPGLDKRVARRRLAIDRVLDLHGFTQVAARTRLEDFLQRAHTDRCRCVLVITGKGGPASAANMARARKARRHDPDTAPHSELQRMPGGILRERVPQWIDGSALHSVVSRVARARPRDGGDGAYYIFLKAK